MRMCVCERMEARRRCRLRHLFFVFVFCFPYSTLDLEAMRERGAVICVCVRGAQALPFVKLRDPPTKHQLLSKELVHSVYLLYWYKKRANTDA